VGYEKKNELPFTPTNFKNTWECVDRGNTFRITSKEKKFILTKHGDRNQLCFKQEYASKAEAVKGALENRYAWKF